MSICAVILALEAMRDADQDMRAVRRHGGDGGFSCEEKDGVDARLGDVGEALECGVDRGQRAGEERVEIAGVLIDDAHGNLLQTQGADFRNHAAGLEGSSQLRLRRGQDALGLGADVALSRSHPRVQRSSLAG